jgi:hypothetical protein
VKLLIVGQRSGTHVAGSLTRAAVLAGHEVVFANAQEAYAGSAMIQALKWRLAGHLPNRLKTFSEHVCRSAIDGGVDLVLTTGISPVSAHCLRRLHRAGIFTANFLTDDPWNRQHRATWFFDALSEYDHVFSPRRLNLGDLRSRGARCVHYLPFGYDPDLFFPAREQVEDEVMFAGGADADRIPYVNALLEANVHLALYGGYWERFASTRSHSRGIADVETLRRAIAGCQVALCLVRRSNRDGTSMRSFEVPAVGACMLMEETAEHREIFGADNEAVAYFTSERDMLDKCRWLLSRPEERQRLHDAAHSIIVTQRHTYGDRLSTMLELSTPHLHLAMQPALGTPA